MNATKACLIPNYEVPKTYKNCSSRLLHSPYQTEISAVCFISTLLAMGSIRNVLCWQWYNFHVIAWIHCLTNSKFSWKNTRKSYVWVCIGQCRQVLLQNTSESEFCYNGKFCWKFCECLYYFTHDLEYNQFYHMMLLVSVYYNYYDFLYIRHV